MAQQNRHQFRPFMDKQTFDQVSANDSDIREEALYFAGMAPGLRIEASQKPNQPTMQQDRPSALNDGNGYQPGYSRLRYPELGGHGSFGAAFQPQLAPQRPLSRPPGIPPPFHVSGSVFGPPPPQKVLTDLFGPAPPQHALSGIFGPTPPHNAFAGYSYTGYSGCDAQDREIDVLPPFRSNLGAYMPVISGMRSQGASRSNDGFLREGAITANLGSRFGWDYGLRQDLDMFPVRDLPPRSAGDLGSQSAPSRTQLLDPLAAGQASQSHNEVPPHHPKPQSPTAARKGDSSRTATVEDHPEDSSDDDHANIFTPSSNESTDNWFEEQGAREM